MTESRNRVSNAVAVLMMALYMKTLNFNGLKINSAPLIFHCRRYAVCTNMNIALRHYWEMYSLCVTEMEKCIYVTS